MASRIYVNIGSGNGLLPVWCRTITWTNDYFIVSCIFRNKVQWNVMQNMKLFISLQHMAAILFRPHYVNTLRPRQNGRYFPDDIFKCIFLYDIIWISIKISNKFVPEDPINNFPALIQIMAWCRPGYKPLSEPMMVRLPTHICVTRPQHINAK